jgi:type IV secretory pathway VirB3-like protein
MGWMMSDYKIRTHPLAVALTKPSTKLGVPFAPFYFSIMLTFFSWMLYQGITGNMRFISVFIFLGMWFCSYAVMFLITSRDIFGLGIFWINLRYFRRHPSHALWNNTDSYSP